MLGGARFPQPGATSLTPGMLGPVARSVARGPDSGTAPAAVAGAAHTWPRRRRGERAASGKASWKRRPVQGRAGPRGGDAGPPARGRGPEGRCYAVTIMAAVTGSRRPCAAFPRPAPRPAGPAGWREREAGRPRLPSPRPGPRSPATWRRRCPAAPRRCGRRCLAPGLRGPPRRPQTPGPPARQPRPRCHGNRAGPRAPDVAPARWADSAHAPQAPRADRPRSRGCGAGVPATVNSSRVRPRPSPMGSSRRLSSAPERDTNKYLFGYHRKGLGLV